MSTASVGLHVSFHIREDAIEEFRQLASGLASGRVLGPCLERAAFVSLHDPLEFLWVERWSDVESLDRYLTSEAFRALVGGIRVLGRLDGQLVVSCSRRPSPPDGTRS
jgi:quinol monooxygenase YgiN